jgi:hypothetical protein
MGGTTMPQVVDYRKNQAAGPDIVYVRYRSRHIYRGTTYPGGFGIWHIFTMNGSQISPTARCGKAWDMTAEMTAEKPRGTICARCQRFAPETKG